MDAAASTGPSPAGRSSVRARSRRRARGRPPSRGRPAPVPTLGPGTAAADSAADIPGIPLPPGLPGPLGGDVYDVVYQLDVEPGSVILASLSGSGATTSTSTCSTPRRRRSSPTRGSSRGPPARRATSRSPSRRRPAAASTWTSTPRRRSRGPTPWRSRSWPTGLRSPAWCSTPAGPARIDHGLRVAHGLRQPLRPRAHGLLRRRVDLGAMAALPGRVDLDLPRRRRREDRCGHRSRVPPGSISAPVSASVVLDTERPGVTSSIRRSATISSARGRRSRSPSASRSTPRRGRSSGSCSRRPTGSSFPAPTPWSRPTGRDVPPVEDLVAGGLRPLRRCGPRRRRQPRRAHRLLGRRRAAGSRLALAAAPGSSTGGLRAARRPSDGTRRRRVAHARGAPGGRPDDDRPRVGAGRRGRQVLRARHPVVHHGVPRPRAGGRRLRRRQRRRGGRRSAERPDPRSPPAVIRAGRVGARTTVAATIAPVAAGVAVAFRLERWSTTTRAWRLVGTLGRRTDAAGRASVAWTPRGSGLYRWRATAASTLDYSTAASAWVRWSIGR